MSFVPNILSLSRIVFAFAVFWFGRRHHWSPAFICLLAALATDWFDGFLATKLSAQTKLGEQLEDICDLSLSIGCLAGLLYGGIIGWTIVIVVAILALGLSSGIALSKPGRRYFRFSNGMSAFSYLLVVLTSAAIYAWLALGKQQALTLLPIGLGVGMAAAYYKRHRIREWLMW